jgi:hypothetical protein
MTVHLDLRRDLPKLQKALPMLLQNMGGRCEYNQPCAVGVMVNPRKRKWLDTAPYDDTQIDTLIMGGMVRVADTEQRNELLALQKCFDGNDADGLCHLVARLAAKYAPAAKATGATQ